jgi:outer membrane protein assembly factor BamB
MLYFVDRKGLLHAYDIKIDKDIWTFNSGAGSNNAPAIYNDKAFMINKSGELFAIDLKTGQKIWSYKTGDSMFRSPVQFRDRE